ncbi:zinc finger, CCHC-type, retrotransposon gag domain protein [Tanacetum coccineum]
MVNTRHKEVLKGSTSKEVGPSASDADHGNSGSSFSYKGLNFRGFTDEETKVLSSMKSRQVGKAIKNAMPYYLSQPTILKKNEMTTYRNFTACDVPKFDGKLNPIASTRWLSAVKGAFRTSCCKEKHKVNFTSNFLRDRAKMWWDEKVCDKGEEWIGSCTWKDFIEFFNAEYASAEEVDKIREEFETLMQTNETVKELLKKFNELTPYCLGYHRNEKLKVREADLLRKKNKEGKETKRKLEFGDQDTKKPKHDHGRRGGGTQTKTPCKKCNKAHLGYRHFEKCIREEANTIRDFIAQLTAIIVELQAIKDQDEVHDIFLAAKDAKRGKQGKLTELNDVIVEALDEIKTQETNVEILDGAGDGV